MCIIAIKPMGKKMFDDNTIKTMFTNNPNGAGYMYYDKKSNNVIIKKGYMSYKALKSSLDAVGDLTDTNVIMHFRISTSGKIDGLNCHPFPIFESNKLRATTKLGMAHNGVMPSIFIPKKDSKINDTQVFINDVLKKLKSNFVDDDGIKNMIELLIGTNKLAFLDNKNKVTTIGDFITDDGYIYSNSSYKVSALYTPYHSSVFKNVYTTNGAYSKIVCTTHKDKTSKYDDAQNSVYNYYNDSYADDTDFWDDYDEWCAKKYGYDYCLG